MERRKNLNDKFGFVGKIMRKKTTIKDIACFSKGSQINGDLLLDEGKYEYLNGGTKASGTWNEFNVNGKTITISEGGNSCGYVNFMKEKFWCGAHCYYLFDVKCKPKYLYYLLKGNQSNLMKLRSGACMPNIKKSDLGNFKFIYDSDVIHQDKIISIFDNLTNVIYFYEKQIKYFDNLVKARFIEMFGSIHDSKIFVYYPLKEITTVCSGGTPNRDNKAYWESGTIPWVKTTELKNNRLTHVEEFITELGLEESSAKLVPSDTVLIAMYGQGKTRGMTGYLEIEATTNQACACILPTNKMNMIYLWKYFELSYDKLRELAKGGNQPNLNCTMIRDFNILVPPIELQNQYADFVRHVDKSRFDIKKSIIELEREVVYD